MTQSTHHVFATGLALMALGVIGCDTGGPGSSDGGARSDAGMGGSTLATSTGGTQNTAGGTTTGGNGTGGSTAALGGNGTASGTTALGGSASGGATALGGSGIGGVTSACGQACTGATPVCNEAAGACVQCLGDAHCSAPTPACSSTLNACVQCTGNLHCSGLTPTCNTTSNTCVQCTANSHCSGATPGCNLTSNTCVQCTANAHCPDSAPLCDKTQNVCVECLAPTDCKDPAAAACVTGTCEPCSGNGDCAHLAGKSVCKLASGDDDAGPDAGTGPNTCVQCTGSDYATCGELEGKALVCDSRSNTCSTTATEASAGLCQPCVSDAQCAPGELCAEQVFNGQSVGHFCFFVQGDTAHGAPAECFTSGRPYVKAWPTTSIDGQTTTLCGLAVTTCIALNQFRQADCSTPGGGTDAHCGAAPGVDSKCLPFGASQYRCTVVCLSDDDCRSGVTCDTTVNPPVCTLQ